MSRRERGRLTSRCNRPAKREDAPLAAPRVYDRRRAAIRRDARRTIRVAVSSFLAVFVFVRTTRIAISTFRYDPLYSRREFSHRAARGARAFSRHLRRDTGDFSRIEGTQRRELASLLGTMHIRTDKYAPYCIMPYGLHSVRTILGARAPPSF